MSTTPSKKAATASLILIVSLIPILSCKHSQPHQVHHGVGVVESIDKEMATVQINHEDIKDYMPAMTMPFNVQDDWVFEIATPGNRIAASLVVDGTQSWLEEVVLTEDTVSAPGAPRLKAPARNPVRKCPTTA